VLATAAAATIVGGQAQAQPAAPTADDYRQALAAIRALTTEVQDLKGEVRALKAQVDAPAAISASTAPPVQTLPGPSETASPPPAIEANDGALRYRGLTFTPSGFIEAANQYRSKALGSDMFSPFGTIPFANVRPGHEPEDRFSARGSRIALLITGNVDPATHLAAYGEFDFLGAAQSANLTESNSFQPRLRHMYATVDLDRSGWHVLAGQTWSLTTLNSKGITPRNEMIPVTVDAQFVPGFIWARQPQVRVVKDFDKTLWLALSVEDAQTTFAGAVPPGVITQITNNTGLFGGTVGGSAPVTAGGGTATIPTLATSSLNSVPDVVAKAAVELTAAGRPIHLEAFGLGRGFSDRIGRQNETVYGGGIGAGLVATLVPERLDLQLYGITGRGVGRYGTSGLPDVTFDALGHIKPIRETAWLAGATVHASKKLDIYAYGGEEIQDRRAFDGTYGVGLPAADLRGCLVEGGTCAAATHYVIQGAAGFWRKFYEGPYGHMQVGLQYSYTQRHAFSGMGGLAPSADEHIVYTSFRYYPFQ
jgi:hypothetical protein